MCNLGNIDSEGTATATLEFALKPTFPTGTPFTTAFAVTQRQGGSPLPREELVPSNNSTSVSRPGPRPTWNALVALYNATDGRQLEEATQTGSARSRSETGRASRPTTEGGSFSCTWWSSG